MRNLQTKDLFTTMKIISAAGLRNEVKAMAERVNAGEKLKMEDVGFNFIFNCVDACTNAKVEGLLYEFVGGLLEIAPEEVKTMEPLTLLENVKKLGEVIDLEAWKGFFISLAAFLRE